MPRFGELETAIMHQLWSTGRPMAVREVRDALSSRRDYAYTTVMTVMDNLHKKGWLSRELSGRAYLYEPTASREDYTARLMGEALSESDDRAAAFMHFVDQMSPTDAEALQSALRRASRRNGRKTQK